MSNAASGSSSRRRRMGGFLGDGSLGGRDRAARTCRDCSAARGGAASDSSRGGAGARQVRYPRFAMAIRPYETLTEAEWSQVDRIHELVDDGELETARTTLDDMLRRRPDHPDLRIEDA